MIKRQKQESHKKTHASKVFAPYRTIGLVSNKVPFTVTNLGQSFVITTVVGKSFQVYDASNLGLLFVSQPQTESDIQCIHSHFHHVFLATKQKLKVYKRAREVQSVDLELEQREKPLKILNFGEFLVLATTSGIKVYKWDAKTHEIESYTKIGFSQILGSVVDICHLPTYLNKLVVATQTSLVLVNIKTGSIVHTFDEVPSGISLVEPSPTALDIVAVAAANGDVHLFNIKTAVTLFVFKIGEPIVTMSFRSDAPLFGVGTSSGDVFFYDLNSRRRVHSVRGLHKGAVVNLNFLQSQPICVSSGTDNVLYELAFDPSISQSDTAITPPPRILRQRGGHSRPPSTMAFTDTEAHFLLSGSLDQTLWAFSLRKDAQSHEFSQRQQGKLKAKSQMSREGVRDKFPPIVEIAYESNKERQWDNILTVHKNEPFARTWSGKRGIVGAFQLQTIDGANAKSVSISRCGNFGFVGSSSGGIAGYNMQSGKFRKSLANAHASAVTGVTCDAVNSMIISGSLDGTIKFHDFKSLELIKTIKTGSAVSKLSYHPGCGLVAAALDSMEIVLIDIVTFKKVREMRGHGNRITDFDFSPDGRWIISGSLDNTIRTWDIPTGGCIDAVSVSNPVTCLRLSPGGEWMATAHVNGVGISLWTLRSQFHTVSTRHVSEADIKPIVMPNVAGEGASGLLDGANEDEDEDPYFEENNWDRPDKLAPELETLSLEPRHKFNMLINLDIIKERNKPKEAPKAPEKAPFFLGMPKEDQQEEKQESTNESYRPAPKGSEGTSKFTALLNSGDFNELCDYLATVGPSATDLELRSLQIQEELLVFVDALISQVEARRNFELVQAWIKMVLDMHSEVFATSPPHKEALERLIEVEQLEIKRMQELSRYGAGVLRYLRAL